MSVVTGGVPRARSAVGFFLPGLHFVNFVFSFDVGDTLKDAFLRQVAVQLPNYVSMCSLLLSGIHVIELFESLSDRSWL